MRTINALAALAALTAFATPAAAQVVTSSDQIEARALLIQPATLQRLDDLSFGTIIATPTLSGSVSINANTGVRSIGPFTAGPDAGQRGRFIGNGNPAQLVNLSASFPTFLSNTADVTRTVGFTGSLDTAAQTGSITIGATGVFYVGVGGAIAIATNQMPGLYTGQVTVTADFQ